jgi:hypothetical protein
MKWNWKDIRDYFKDQAIWETENDMYWYHLVWDILFGKGLTVFHDNVEKLTIYAKIISLVRIYHDFCHVAYDESPEFEIDLGLPEEVNAYIMANSSDQSVFDILKEEFGREITFYSLIITVNSGEEKPYNNYDEYKNLIVASKLSELNDTSVSNLEGYQWLSNYM